MKFDRDKFDELYIMEPREFAVSIDDIRPTVFNLTKTEAYKKSVEYCLMNNDNYMRVWKKGNADIFGGFKP
jgi:hypothetical protein